MSRPYECRALMKKYFQCLNHHNDVVENCVDLDYNSCLEEHKTKIFENRIFNVNTTEASEEEE